LQGRPGPVVIALPEDMLQEMAEVADAPRVNPVEIWPAATQLRALESLLHEAEKPIMIVGGSGWDAAGAAAITRFAESFDLPAAASFRRATLIPNDHPCYAGEVGIGVNPKLRERIESADLVLLFGGRMGDIPSQGYQLLDIPRPRQKLVHVHADAGEIGRLYHADLGIVATPNEFAAAVEKLTPPTRVRWAAQREAAQQNYLDWTKAPAPGPGSVQLAEIFLWLRDRLAGDAIVTNGAGNFALWVGRYLRYRRFGGHLGPVSGSMGYGLPAAVAAKRLYPERSVVCFCGDGDFLMNGQEFATAVQYELPIVVVVIDNGMYGTIRMHQERRYPGRVCGTALRNPDFAAYARAFGGHGETVEKTGDFAAAFERCRSADRPSIIHIKVDGDAITPSATLSGLRAAAMAR
jgi:acetolactate synthase-1/2/3 large subunit